MNQKEKMTQDLLSEIDGFYMNLVYIKDLIDVEAHISNNSSVNQKSPNFSMIVQCALVDSYILGLMKLYDKSESAKTIPNLIEKCKKNTTLFRNPEEVETQLEKFEKELKCDEFITQAISVLRVRRDGYHVHNDKKYFGVKITNDQSHLPMYCIWMLKNFSEKVLSYLWGQLTEKECRKTKYDNDLDNLL